MGCVGGHCTPTKDLNVEATSGVVAGLGVAGMAVAGGAYGMGATAGISLAVATILHAVFPGGRRIGYNPKEDVQLFCRELSKNSKRDRPTGKMTQKQKDERKARKEQERRDRRIKRIE